MADHTESAGRQSTSSEGLYGTGSPARSQSGEPEKPHTAFFGDSTNAATNWINERLGRVMGNADFTKALRAITGRGTAPPNVIEMLSPLLVSLAILAANPHRVNRRSWEKLWAAGTGKTWKALTEFPDRIERMAQEIQDVGGGPFFAPVAFINAKTPEAQAVRKRFEQLPGIMRLYAEGLPQQIKRVPVLSAKTIPSIQRRGDDTLVSLSSVIRIITGRWLDQQAAELVNTAAIALGVDRQIDARIVYQARYRWKQERPYLQDISRRFNEALRSP